MKAVNLLRSRQEERELVYWLSIIAYDPRDHSINNRIYLIYLVLFFSVWVFITLLFFASGGAVLLHMINPEEPGMGAVLLQLLCLAGWSLLSLGKALRRSPIPLSEEDGLLICQTPVSRRKMILRWLLMPWLTSAIPFWLIAVTLGFSLAENTITGGMGAGHLVEYTGFGLRSWLTILPVHLALYAMQWTAGILRLQEDRQRPWLAPAIFIPAAAMTAALLAGLPGAASIPARGWGAITTVLLLPLRVGFGYGSLWSGVGISWILVLLFLEALYLSAGSLSLNRAAGESAEAEILHQASRYGMASYTQEVKTRGQVGIARRPFSLPARAGPWMLIWKDILQSLWTLRIAALLNWAMIPIIMLAFPLLPDVGSKAVALAFWMINVGRVCITRLRSDLAAWPVIRQLPFSSRQFLFADFGPASILAVAVSLAGSTAGSLLVHSPPERLAVLIPGIAAGAVGMAAFDVISSARKNLLSGGEVPDLSARGILLGLLLAVIPVSLSTLVQGAVGLLLALLSSILLGSASLLAAERTYRNITHNE